MTTITIELENTELNTILAWYDQLYRVGTIGTKDVDLKNKLYDMALKIDRSN